MQVQQTTAQIATELDIIRRIRNGIESMLPDESAAHLLETVLQLPIRSSHALRSLGSYISRGGKPTCIRLQFRQEPKLLAETLLHEIAHLCDHLTNQNGRPYRQAHGTGWQQWARAFSIPAKRCGQSQALREIHQKRLKLVAVCQRCGTEIRRLRRLNRGTRYIHPECGGRLRPISQ